MPPPPANPHWPTDGTAAVVPTTDAERQPVFVVLAKRTYTIRPNAAPTPAAAPAPLALIDRYHNDGDPQETTVRIENETAPFKVATDVVVVGSVWAPRLRPTRQTDATLEVGTAKKTVRVIGDRTCEHRTGQSPRVSDPEPFVEMPCQYD